MSVNGFPFEKFVSIDKQNIPSEILSKINKNSNLKEIKLQSTQKKSQFKQFNEHFHKELLRLMSPMKYEELISQQLEVTSVTDNELHISVATERIKSVLLTQYHDQLTTAIETIAGKELNPIFSVTESANTASEAYHQPRNANEVKFTLDLNSTREEKLSKADSVYLNHVNQSNHEMMIDPKKTFESFIIGPSNNMAFSAAKAVAKNPGNRGDYPTLYIHSGSGLGKTHLLHAVANEIKENYPELIICLVSAKEFIGDMIEAVQKKKMEEFLKRYTDRVDLLMIDDIHEIKNKEGTQDMIFDIFNVLHKKGKQLIFTSDIAPSKIEGIHERLKTRLSWGLVIDIQKPDLETRMAILKRKATEIDLYLSDEILNLIAVSIRTSIRELEGALLKLHAYFQLMGIDLDFELVKNYLNLETPNDEKTITLESVAKATSQYYRITVVDLKSKGRKKEVTQARHVAMYLSRKIVNATLEEIGRFYGGRDHSTVISAERAVVQRLTTDASLSKDVLYIENNL